MLGMISKAGGVYLSLHAERIPISVHQHKCAKQLLKKRREIEIRKQKCTNTGIEGV